MSSISYRIFETLLIWVNLCNILLNIWDIAHISECLQYLIEYLRDIPHISECLQYLIKYLRDIAHMTEWVCAIPQGLNRPGASSGATAKIVLKNTRICDKNSPVSYIEGKSHCFETDISYSSTLWRHPWRELVTSHWALSTVIPVWVCSKTH